MQQVGFWLVLAAVPLLTAAVVKRARVGLGRQPVIALVRANSCSGWSPPCFARTSQVGVRSVTLRSVAW